MTAPSVEDSDRSEREEYIREHFKCISNCESCGLCRVFRGRDPMLLFAPYIEGRVPFEIVLKKVRD